jgi:hypothetical protein
VLRPGLQRDGRRLVGGRRGRAGDHLTPEAAKGSN